jgi:hypothetical protein
MPGARRTRGPCAKGSKHTVVTTGTPESDPAFPAQRLYGLLRALPGGPGFLATIASVMRSDITCVMRRHHHQLDASVGASGPHGFAVREQRHSSRDVLRPSYPAPNVRDDRETPLSWDGMAGDKPMIWVKSEAGFFS